MSESKIETKAAGPIEGTFEIDLSPGFGAYEFRGQCGSGKSTLLNSIDLLAGHKVDITLHDGEMSGHVRGFGVVAPIGSRKRRKGSLELETLDAEKFSPSDIIDPPGKTPQVRDARRIKALASQLDVKADAKLYHEVAGGKASFAQLGIAPTDDPVVLAQRVKDKFDALAKEAGRVADAEASNAEALEFVPEDLDMSAPSDMAELSATRDVLRDRAERLRNERENGIKREAEARDASQKLAILREEYDGPTVEDATKEWREAQDERNSAEKVVEELRTRLNVAEDALNKRNSDLALAIERGKTAKAHEQAVAVLEETASQIAVYPTEDDIGDIEDSVGMATSAYDRGVRIRDVKAKHAQAKDRRVAEDAARKEADDAKNKAGEVFDILAQSLKMQHIRIVPCDGDPRLMVTHEKRGKCFFDSVNGLSDGERVRVTLLELLPHLGSPGVFVVPQRTWQDLQPADRMNLCEIGKEKQLYIFGAQVDDGELRVEFMG